GDAGHHPHNSIGVRVALVIVIRDHDDVGAAEYFAEFGAPFRLLSRLGRAVRIAGCGHAYGAQVVDVFFPFADEDPPAAGETLGAFEPPRGGRAPPFGFVAPPAVAVRSAPPAFRALSRMVTHLLRDQFAALVEVVVQRRVAVGAAVRPATPADLLAPGPAA